MQDGVTIPADGRVVGDFSDRGNQKSKDMLARIRQLKAKVAAEKGISKENEGEEGGLDLGVAIAAADQSAITGESLAVDKHLDDFVFYTT